MNTVVPVLLAVLIALAAVAPAEARDAMRLPLGSSFTGLAVAPTGQVWAAADTGRGGRWGRVGGAWTSFPLDHGFLGMLSARPDGGAWMLADAQTVLRIDADGQAARFGPVEVPAQDSEYTDVTHHLATAGDGSLVLGGELGRFLRIAPDGTATARQVPVPPARRSGCFATGLDAIGGDLVMADYRCSRLLTFTRAGEARTVDLRPPRGAGRRFPTGVLARPGGSLWYTAVTLRGAHVRSVIGRVAPDGTVTQHDAPDVRGQALTAAPDGTIWAPAAGACAVYRVRDGRVDRVPAPFLVKRLRFAPDGGAWLQGHSRLVRLRAAELEAPPRPRRCDTRSPRIRYPDAFDGPGRYDYRSLSLRLLRRRGLRVTSSEPATFAGELRIDDEVVHVHAVIRRPGGTAAARFPREVLDRLEERVRRERDVEMYSHAPVWDPSGNGIVTGYPFTLVP
jgi:streptogramin lyase